MCKAGDIILISQALDNGYRVGTHPFLVLDDNNGVVRGTYKYDFIALLMSSNTTPAKNNKLHKYPGNFPISPDDKIITDSNYDNLNSFVEADLFYYFDKSKINYIHLGNIDDDIYNLVIEFIDELNQKGVVFREILDNSTDISSQQ